MRLALSSQLPMYYELKLGLYIYLGLMNGASAFTLILFPDYINVTASHLCEFSALFSVSFSATIYQMFGKKAIQVTEKQVQVLAKRPEVVKCLDAFHVQNAKLEKSLFKKEA